jgi:hypothetical protein
LVVSPALRPGPAPAARRAPPPPRPPPPPPDPLLLFQYSQVLSQQYPQTIRLGNFHSKLYQANITPDPTYIILFSFTCFWYSVYASQDIFLRFLLYFPSFDTLLPTKKRSVTLLKLFKS